jgi:hypothetical protein
MAWQADHGDVKNGRIEQPTNFHFIKRIMEAYQVGHTEQPNSQFLKRIMET